MTGRKEQLKALFETGKIPFGEHFAEFIDDSYNNYKIVDMFDPKQKPSEFEQGVSVLVFNFDPIENPDWDTLFGGDVSPGDVMVRTLRYDGAGVVIQEFDTNRNGRYYPNKSRIGLIDDTWGLMQDHPEVISVNHQKPDVNGNITVDSGPQGPQGPPGKDGDKWYVSDYPPTTAKENDIWLDATTGGVRYFYSGQWSPTMIYLKGEDGNKWYVEPTNPGSAETGDCWLNTDTGDLYIFNDGMWYETDYNLKGPQGPPGEDGKDGTKWYAGPYEPAPSEGENGDYWLNTDTGDIYYYAGGVWNLSTGNLKGPQGDPGSILDDLVLPTTPPQDFQKGFTITSPHGNSGNSVYVAWRDWIIESTGANIDYTLPFLIYIETTKSDYPKTSQTIRVIVPSFGGVGYNEVMRLYRFSLTETGAFNPPGVEMTTIRGSGNPEGTVYGLIGNSYYDYTNKIMYIKTEEGPVDPQANGWVVESSGGSGTPGPKGDKGDPGEQGIQGLPGAEGAVGPKGDKGDKGETGSQGNPGTNGLDGAKGDKGDTGATGPKGDKGDKGDTGATGPQGIPGEDGDPLQIANNLTTTVAGKALDATQGKKLADDLSEHVGKVASTTELGHVKIDGTSVKMHENNQLYVDVGDLPIPIQINNEYVLSDSPTTYPVGHTITMLGPDDPGFADLISEFNLDYDIELTSLNTRFIVQTVKNKNSMTHQTAQAITNNRGSVLGTLYRFSQSSYYGFSSWYSQTHVLTGRGAPGDQGRGEGISGNLYVNSITGKVHAKAGYDKTVGYTNWRVVGPTVVNDTFYPVEDDDEHVYSAYTVDKMFEGAKNNLENDVKLNRIWDSRPITANATTWTVDFSDEEELTDLNNYWFEVYDDGVLVFGNPITHTINNDNKTVTFTPQTPMSRPFTITCIGRGMEFPQ